MSFEAQSKSGSIRLALSVRFERGAGLGVIPNKSSLWGSVVFLWF